jgi:hypothetical protein
MALAGAGVRGGQVIGASDKNGAYPVTDPIRGGDLTATIFHLLGIDPGGMFLDRTNRPHPLTKGEPIAAALGDGPATTARCRPGGDVAFVPPYDSSLLLDTAFDPNRPLIPPAPLTRAKGWRAAPIWDAQTGNGLAVRKDAAGVAIGYGLGGGGGGAVIAADARCVLAQEVRNARGGQYTFTLQATGEATSADEFEAVFLAHFACRLVLFRFRDTSMDPRGAEELASAEFRPAFGKADSFKVARFLGSTAPGVNFPIGNGLGVAVVVEKRTPGALALPGSAERRAALRVRSVALEFSAAPRHDNDLL